MGSGPAEPTEPQTGVAAMGWLACRDRALCGRTASSSRAGAAGGRGVPIKASGLGLGTTCVQGGMS